MRVREVMVRGIESVSPDMTVREAAAKLARLDVTALPVLREGRSVGLLRADDVAGLGGHGHDPGEERVRDLMREGLATVSVDLDAGEARRWMEGRQLTTALVVDREQLVLGAVTLGDLAVLSSTEHWFAGH